MPVEYLTVMLRDDTLEGRVKCLILADMLKARAAIFEAQGKPDECLTCYQKAFHFFYDILIVKDSSVLQEFFTPETLQDRFTAMAEVVDHLIFYQLPEDIIFKLMNYYEQTELFSRAEDMLFEALDMTEDEAPVIDQGITFYKRLRLKSEVELEAGNLPREEVEAGLKELLERGERRTDPPFAA
jgi:hypothetical protein